MVNLRPAWNLNSRGSANFCQGGTTENNDIESGVDRLFGNS